LGDKLSNKEYPNLDEEKTIKTKVRYHKEFFNNSPRTCLRNRRGVVKEVLEELLKKG
jgi:hypothetical protein